MAIRISRLPSFSLIGSLYWIFLETGGGELGLVWKNCGYVSLTKNKKGVIVVVKRTRYFVKLDEVKTVVEGNRGYALVYEPVAADQTLVGQ
jgi:hypothetical protein